MNKVYCVISHTHWDREWYKSYEQFRMQLTNLINNLLCILKKYPNYQFHLDAQTIVLEDYLEIYPDKKEELSKWIQQGNILVGPWYLQNDFYLTSGEATVRNLIEGNRIAQSFGKCSKVGYAPDQFGNISQIPQILSDFGIDNFVFGRGFDGYHQNEDGTTEKDKFPSEFIWEGADGTRALAIHLKYWYNNAQRFSADLALAKKLVQCVESSFEGVAMTPYLLLMNGVDHLEAQDNLLPILESLNRQDIHGAIEQTTLCEYINHVKEYVKENSVPLMTHSGELRMGGDGQILQGTLSSRIYLKQLNVQAQSLIENGIEPLYSMLELAGCKNAYPQEYLHYLWKRLMQNHPHDSICGCSRDEVHSHMEDRYQSIREVTDVLLKKGLEVAAYHNAAAINYPKEYSLVAVNTIGIEQEGVIRAEFLFPINDHVDGFSIYDAQGQQVRYGLISRKKELLDLFSPVNLPGWMEVERCSVYLYVSNTQPFSIQGYSVRKSDQKEDALTSICDILPYLENRNLKVTISTQGGITLEDKKHNRTLKDVLYLEECGDRGDAYLFRPAFETPLTTQGLLPEIKVLEKNEYVQKCKLTWQWKVPSCFEFEKHCRSKQETVMPVSITLTLKKDSDTLELSYAIQNTAKDHRVRLCVKTDVFTDQFETDIPFDRISHRDGFHHPDTTSLVQPNTSYAAIEKDSKGFAVFTQGNHECEKIGDSMLAFTLVRSTGVINRNLDDTAGGGSQWNCPENQCSRLVEGRFGMVLFNSPIGDAQLSYRALRFRRPLFVQFTPCDSKKFSGGRTAVQDSSLAELFYQPDPYQGVELRSNNFGIEVTGKHVVISALKNSEDGKGTILRFYQAGDCDEQVTIRVAGDVYKSNMAEDVRKFLGSNRVEMTVARRKIVTLFIDYKKNEGRSNDAISG